MLTLFITYIKFGCNKAEGRRNLLKVLLATKGSKGLSPPPESSIWWLAIGWGLNPHPIAPFCLLPPALCLLQCFLSLFSLLCSSLTSFNPSFTQNATFLIFPILFRSASDQPKYLRRNNKSMGFGQI